MNNFLVKTAYAAGGHEVTIFAEPIFNIGNFTVTNSLLNSWLTVLVVFIFALIIKFKIKKIPGKLQHVFEIFLNGSISLLDQITNNRKISNKIFPFVFSVFIFILFKVNTTFDFLFTLWNKSKNFLRFSL